MTDFELNSGSISERPSMADFTKMPRVAKAYWLLVIAAGCSCLVRSLAGWQAGQESLLKLAIYVVAGVFAANLKIRLPGILGTLSMNYVVVIVALQDLSLGSAVIVGTASTLVQCLIHASERPKWFQVLFSVAGIPFPVMAAQAALKSRGLLMVDHSGYIALLVASMAYYVINTVTVAGIISCTSGKPVYETWRKSYLWTSPHYLVGGAIAGATHYLSTHWGWPALLMAAPPLYLVYRSYSLYLGRIEEQQKHILEMSGLHLRTIETLALAIDAKDDTTAAHLRRVQVYATEIGKELNLTASEMKALDAAALLHDVGKLAVPEYIISKPGKLTEEEFEKMKVHPVVGAEILERVQFPYPVVPIVRSHHEKYDGTGYPDGLAGEEIPIGARILSAVDCLDALASARQYRQAMPLEDAMRIVVEQSGKSYDPKVVAILQRRFRELELKAKAETIDLVKLSSNIKVERGVAPGAGFAEPENETSNTSPTGDFSHAISSARREFQLMVEATNDLGNSLCLEETLAVLAVRVNRLVEHDAIAIYLAQEDKLIPHYVKGESFRLFSSLEIPVGQGLSGWVAENDLPILNGNPAVESGYLNAPRLVTPLRSAVSVPLRSRDRIAGVLTLYSLRAAAFTADHRRVLLAIASRAGHAIENSLRFEMATNAADTDELTGLVNSRYLYTHLQQEVARNSRSGDSFAVILIDLDGFKNANDQYGHLAGNRILRAVSAGLRKNCRAGEVVARLGGDEFVVVLSGAGEHVDATLARMEETVGTLKMEADCTADITFSAGVSRFPDDGIDAESLLAKADERMYDAKRRKKLTIVPQEYLASKAEAAAAVAVA
jgi:diguanylate cyclase (GGDEF)-like protein/putative nucleotidyltransferase with HDIG domain